MTSLSQYTIPVPGGQPGEIVTGSDGNLWFNATNSIGRINPTTHAVTDYVIPTPNAQASAIAAGPDGNIWFTELQLNKIGMINTTTGVISEFPLPSQYFDPEGIAAGSDGNLWFTNVGNGGDLGSINPTTHVISEVPISGSINPSYIAAGADGNLWATGLNNGDTAGFLIKLNPSTKAVTTFQVSAAGSSPSVIASGPDGNLWFLDNGTDAVGTIKTSNGAISEFSLSTVSGTQPVGIGAGPDGNLYFDCLKSSAYQIGTINATTDAISLTPFPAREAAYRFTPGPDGNVWFTDVFYGNTTVGTINPTTKAVAEYANPAGASSFQVTTGADGNLWFTDNSTRSIGSVNPTTGAIVEYNVPDTIYQPEPITLGTDGNLWFVDGPGIWDFDPTTHVFTDVAIPSVPFEGSITTGPDGNIWFAADGRGYLGTVNVKTHALTEYHAPTGINPAILTSGPDGNLWFTDDADDSVGKFNTATAAFTEYAIPTAQSDPVGIVTGSDGNLWFIEGSINYATTNHTNVAEINPTTGVISEFPLTPYFSPASIAAGCDGNLWYSGPGSIGSITPGTKAMSDLVSIPTYNPQNQLTAGPDGNLWYNDGDAIGVVRITQTGAAVKLSAAAPSGVSVGQPFGITVKAEDGSGNLVSSFGGTITLTLADNPAGASLGGTLTATAVNGVATFSGLTLSKVGNGVTLLASGGGLIESLTPAFNVNPVATQVVVTSQPPGSLPAGNSFGFTVSAEDANGSVVSGYSGTFVASLLNNPGNATLGGTTTITVSGGIATFSGLSISRAGSGYTIQVTSTGLSPAATGSILVTTPTTTTLTTSNGSPAFGQSVTLTATVAPTAGAGPATGSVTFTDGSTMLGTVTLNGSGVATLATSTLAVGSHSVVAAYMGDTIDLASQSSALAFAVGQESTTTTLSASPTSTTFGQPVTLTAIVAAAKGEPTGMVTFTDGSTTLGTVALNGSGIATLTTSGLMVGSHPLVAAYLGDINDQSSQSSSLALMVGQLATTTTLAASPNPVAFGQSVTLTATVTASNGVPTGSVTFTDGSTTLGTITLNGSGVAMLTTSTLAVGPHALVASYAGDANDSLSQSASTALSVTKQASTTTLSASANPVAFGQAVTLTATVTAATGMPTGSITFADGSTTLGTVTLNGSGVATLTTSSLMVGSQSLSASYGGDANDLTALSAPVAVTVAQDSTRTTVSASSSTAAFGQAVVLTAVVTVLSPGNGHPGGSVLFMEGTQPIGSGAIAVVGGVATATLTTSGLASGSQVIDAVYSGDANDLTSTSATVSLVIGTRATTTTLVLAPATTNAGEPLTLSVSVAALPSGGPIPTGSVVFQEDGQTIGTATLNASGVASFTTPGLTPGPHTFAAMYLGDGSDSAGHSALLSRVIHAAPLDFDGDGKTDMAVFGYQVGYGYRIKIATSSTGFSASRTTIFNNNGYGYGNAQSIPVPGDYFGDGRSSYALWTPNAFGGMTFTAISPSTYKSVSVNFGSTTDIPVEADVDGDGKTDFGVYGYQPGLGYRFDFLLSSDNFAATQQLIFNNNGYGYGGPSSIPIVADFDGSGRAGFGIYNPSATGSNFAYVNPYSGASIARTVGTATDIPFAADFDGDGKADLVLYGLDPAAHGTYRYEVLTSTTNFNVAQPIFFNNNGYGYGNAQSIPVAADYEGNGKSDFALFGPDNVSGSQFIYQTSRTGAGVISDFATLTDIPLDAPSYLIAKKVRGH